MTNSLQAVLWDMDGTLVDTEPVWWRAEIDTLTRLGGEWTLEDCKTLVGSDLAAAVKVWMRSPSSNWPPRSMARSPAG